MSKTSNGNLHIKSNIFGKESRLTINLDKIYEISKISVNLLQFCSNDSAIKVFDVYVGQQYYSERDNRSSYQDYGNLFCSNFQVNSTFKFQEKTISCPNKLYGNYIQIVIKDCQLYLIDNIRIYGENFLGK